MIPAVNIKPRRIVAGLLLSFTLSVSLSIPAFAEKIDLSGLWAFSLDPEGKLSPDSALTETIALPGTTDTNRKGTPLTDRGITTRLSRKYSYKGRAWYSRTVDIPSDWRGDSVYLFIERTKPTEIYIDSRLVGSSNDISTPQTFNLSSYLIPGRHTLTVMVDNGSGVPAQLYGSSHAYCEDTQTNWNGMIGEISISNQPWSPSLPSPVSVNPAFRNFKIKGVHFYADGHPVFLRGRHDACVWPLTAHVAMDREQWDRYFGKCREYGLNHVRFHSWCPPEAAFAAADDAGIYLQPELPFWGDFNDRDSTLMEFLHKEGENILRTYGHHPSFRLFALGNELWGSIDMMGKFVEDFRAIAPDKLYTFGSNYYLGYQGVKPGMDFFVTCRVGGEGWGNYDTHTRGSFSFADAADGGIINHFYPNTEMTLESGCSRSTVPVISHETAQFQSFPDFDEMTKYTGVLEAANMAVFKQRLEKAGMADLADLFHEASGKWAVELYKQDIELDLRTPSMSGFQLLDLQDYPGQGSAYVGILDAFQDSKGFVSPEEWRGWCDEVVPLLSCDRFCFSSTDTLRADLLLANYGGKSLRGKKLSWNMGDRQGSLEIPDGEGLVKVGPLRLPLGGFAAPSQLRLTLNVEGRQTPNRYNIWVYPEASKADLTVYGEESGLIVASKYDASTAAALDNGRTVMLGIGDAENSVGPLFQTDYWNYRMFKTICENNKKEVSPGTLGLLTDPSHPVYRDFPTEMHTNWQWFPVLKKSRPIILDGLPKDYRPIAWMIDNVERNHRLGLIFEFKVGKGKLLVVATDLEGITATPEGRGFFTSLVNYVKSPQFNPAKSITGEEIVKLLSAKTNETELEELNNISPY